MFAVIIFGLIFIFGILPLFFGGLKKILEVISFIAKLFVGGIISLIVVEWLQLEFKTGLGQLAFIVIGAIIVAALIMALSGIFRLIGYSINYFIGSLILLLLFEMLGDKVEISFMGYALALFVFPRIIWISDRTASTTEYSHSKYSILDNVTTDFYNIKDVDWFEDSGMSWELIPMQIVISAIFYAIGSATIETICPIESDWLWTIYIILVTAINIIFDMFVFRKIDEALNGCVV